jgi:mannose-6-phosphate isomerase-like protein (cupin superfamily)
LVGVAGSTALAQDQPVLGAINIIVPDVWITPAEGGDEVLLSEASSLDPGEVLRTDETGVALVTWFYDGTESAVGQDSSLKLNAFSGDASGAFVIDAELSYGHLTSELGGVAADVSEGGQMTIATPQFVVHPLRGEFELWVTQEGETTLIVTEGRVEVLVGDAEPFPVDANQYLVGAPGEAQELSSDGITPNLTGVCTATTPTNLNVRLAPSEDSRRLGGAETGQVFWVRSSTEGNLWLQVYFQTPPEDEEGHNYGWIYGPAVQLDPDNCSVILRAALDGHLFGGPGVDKGLGTAGESEPIGG